GANGYVEPNPEYDPDGYFYAVEVPPGHSGRLRVQIFDAASCSNQPDSTPTFDLTLRMRSNDSLNPLDATILDEWDLDPGDDCGGGVSFPGTGSNGSTCPSGVWDNCWRTIFDHPN